MRSHIYIKKMKSYLHQKNQKADGSQELMSSKAHQEGSTGAKDQTVIFQ
jgi:hypothetical protein